MSSEWDSRGIPSASSGHLAWATVLFSEMMLISL